MGARAPAVRRGQDPTPGWPLLAGAAPWLAPEDRLGWGHTRQRPARAEGQGSAGPGPDALRADSTLL
jgi:hypothetical protein